VAARQRGHLALDWSGPTRAQHRSLQNVLQDSPLHLFISTFCDLSIVITTSFKMMHCIIEVVDARGGFLILSDFSQLVSDPISFSANRSAA
jgi:hypothetical protein